MITIFSTIATALSIIGNVLLAKKNILVFPIWIIANIMWIVIIALTAMNIPQITMYGVYIGTSIYSWLNWKKEK